MAVGAKSHPSNPPISHNVNFEPKCLEDSRRYLSCLLLCCLHFSLYRNKKRHHRVQQCLLLLNTHYFGDNHYIFFKNCRSLGGVFPFILMGTFSTLALLLLQHVCSHRNCKKGLQVKVQQHPLLVQRQLAETSQDMLSHTEISDGNTVLFTVLNL